MDSTRILPRCSYSRCFCLHTCLHQDRPALSWGPAKPKPRSPPENPEQHEGNDEMIGYGQNTVCIVNCCLHDSVIILVLLGFFMSGKASAHIIGELLNHHWQIDNVDFNTKHYRVHVLLMYVDGYVSANVTVTSAVNLLFCNFYFFVLIAVKMYKTEKITKKHVIFYRQKADTW